MISVRAQGPAIRPGDDQVGRSFLRRVSLGLILFVVWWTGEFIEVRGDNREFLGWQEIGWDEKGNLHLRSPGVRV